MAPRQWILGEDAVDIARLTGLPLNHQLDRHQAKPTIHPNAAHDVPHVYLDLTRLTWWDRLKVAWARIGAHYYLEQGATWSPPVSSSSASSAPSCISLAASSKGETSDQDRDGRTERSGHRSPTRFGTLRYPMARVLSARVAKGDRTADLDAPIGVWATPRALLRELLGQDFLRGAAELGAPGDRA